MIKACLREVAAAKLGIFISGMRWAATMGYCLTIPELLEES
jgi:hypothetical protein